jgi:hypothetical protein
LEIIEQELILLPFFLQLHRQLALLAGLRSL